MHELSVCQSLFAQAGRIARENGAERIDRIVVAIGPLSGVEPPLLARAFEIARAEAGFPNAELDIEVPALRVSCSSCGAESEVAPNKLVCGRCGDWKVRVISGTEMILKSVELSVPDAPAPADAALH